MQFQAADLGNEPVTQANSHDVSDSAEFFGYFSEFDPSLRMLL